MKKIILILMPVLCIGIFSCQKEIDWETTLGTTNTGSNGNNIPPSTDGELLVKSYGKLVGSVDSNVSYYTYNSAKKLIALRNITSMGGASNNWNGYERNASGLIIKRKQHLVSSTLPIQGDTAVTNYYYSNDAVPKLLYGIITIGMAGFATKDSIVYSYNTSGKLIKSSNYTANILTGIYQESIRHIYNYDGAGNCNKIEQYLSTNGTLDLAQTITYLYDNKISRFNYTEAESIIITEEPAASHNLISSKQVIPIAGTIEISFTFNYNSAGRPATGKSVQDYNGRTTTDYTFYYQ